MWISSIKLKNFKAYAQANFEFPEPKEGKNLIIIGALNGRGKTTLLEAIYVGLYGKQSSNHLGRAGLSESRIDYGQYIINALHHEAQLVYRGYQIEISIELKKRNENGELEGLRVVRKWSFDNERNLLDEERFVYKLDNSSLSLPLDDEEADAYFVQQALPLDYAPFFFYDGEKIVPNIAVIKDGAWLRSVLRGLIGATLLCELNHNLSKYLNEHIKEGTNKRTQQEIDALEQTIQRLKNKRDEVQKRLDSNTEEYNKRDIEYNEIFDIIKSTGGSRETVKELTDKKERLFEEEQRLMTQLHQSFEQLPQILLPRKEMRTMMHLLRAEEKRLEHEASKNQAGDRVDDFWNNFLHNQKVRKAMGDMADYFLKKDEFKEAVRECWNALWYPLPEDCADHIYHNYLSQTAHARIKSEYQQLLVMNVFDKVAEVIEKKESVQQELIQVDKQIDDLKDTGKGYLIERFKTLGDEKNEYSALIKLCQNEKIRILSELDREEKNLRKKQDEISANNPKQRKINRSNQMKKLIDDLVDGLIALKIDEISQLATEINFKIFGEQRFTIRVKDDCSIQLYNANKQVITVDLNSVGQLKSLVLALVYAMAEATHYNMPYVIDSPLASLDSVRNDNLIKYWTTLPQQVIIIAQNEELAPEKLKNIRQYISKTYFVTCENLNTGGVVSTVHADRYFD